MSLNNLFSKSVKETKYHHFEHLDVFGNKKFELVGFTNSVKEIKSNIDFLDERVKKSKISKEDKFTNYLSASTPTSVTFRIDELFKDPSIINNVRAGTVELNKEKIVNCISLYFDLSNEENPVIFKSQISDSFDAQTGVRVYAVVDVNIDDEQPKAEYKIVLIDPFHLTIPSAHVDKRKKKKKSKQQMEQETFNKNANNDICMSDYF
jgi:hypothetical protein